MTMHDNVQNMDYDLHHFISFYIIFISCYIISISFYIILHNFYIILYHFISFYIIFISCLYQSLSRITWVLSYYFSPCQMGRTSPVVGLSSQDMKRKSSFSLLDQFTKRPMPGSVLWSRLWDGSMWCDPLLSGFPVWVKKQWLIGL